VAVAIGVLLGALGAAQAAEPVYRDVGPGDRVVLPADEGAHPEFRTEWWYVTGWLNPKDSPPLGFQVTFFRTRPGVDPANPSAFAAHDLVIGHAALSDPRRGRSLHAERIARAGFGLAGT
jgi:predicted secreted hydrolase